MRSAEVAAGVNVQTLGYDERRGLLPEPERLGSGYRAIHDVFQRCRRSCEELGWLAAGRTGR